MSRSRANRRLVLSLTFSTLSFCVLLRLIIKGTKSYSATLHSSETGLLQILGTLPQLLAVFPFSRFRRFRVFAVFAPMRCSRKP